MKSRIAIIDCAGYNLYFLAVILFSTIVIKASTIYIVVAYSFADISKVCISITYTQYK